MTRGRSQRWLEPTFAALLSGIAVIGFALMTVATRMGIGLTPDSAVYLAAARNLRNGLGLSVMGTGGVRVPLVDWPPLFPVLLAGTGLAGSEVIAGARWLNVLFFAINVALVGLAIHVGCRNRALALLGAIFALASYDMLRVHSLALSEPMFICFSLVALLALTLHRQTTWPGMLLVAAAATACAALTRLPGLAFVGAGALSLLANRKRSPGHRLLDSAIFMLCAGFPVLLWIGWAASVDGTLAGRSLMAHPIPVEQIDAALSAAIMWFMPARLAHTFLARLALLLIAALMCAVIVLASRGKQREMTDPGSIQPVDGALTRLSGLFILSYIALVAVSKSFLDAETPLDFRLLLPVYVLGLICVFSLTGALVRRFNPGLILRAALAVACAAPLVFNVARDIGWLRQVVSDGQGYASKQWRQSQLVREVNRLPPETRIFSNGCDVIFVFTDRPCSRIPVKFSANSLQPNKSFAAEMALVERRLRDDKGVLVYFEALKWRGYLPSDVELRNLLPLHAKVHTDEGVIFELDPESSPS